MTHPAQNYWNKVKAGELPMPKGIGKRGKDKVVRAIPASKTVATRYYEKTGRRMDVEMAEQQATIQLMFEAAGQMEDPMDRFTALDKCQAAQAKFNTTWLPYVEQKLGTLQSTTTVEEHKSTDEAIAMAIEHKDED